MYGIYIYVYVCNNNEKISHESETEEWRLYMRVWKEEKESEYDVIITSKKRQQNVIQLFVSIY